MFIALKLVSRRERGAGGQMGAGGGPPKSDAITVESQRICDRPYPANRGLHILNRGGEDSFIAEPVVDADHGETTLSKESRQIGGHAAIAEAPSTAVQPKDNRQPSLSAFRKVDVGQARLSAGVAV